MSLIPVFVEMITTFLRAPRRAPDPPVWHVSRTGLCAFRPLSLRLLPLLLVLFLFFCSCSSYFFSCSFTFSFFPFSSFIFSISVVPPHFPLLHSLILPLSFIHSFPFSLSFSLSHFPSPFHSLPFFLLLSFPLSCPFFHSPPLTTSPSPSFSRYIITLFLFYFLILSLLLCSDCAPCLLYRVQLGASKGTLYILKFSV